MKRWFSRGAKGDLIFDHTPYISYLVTPCERIANQDYMEDRGQGVLHCGRLTIHLKAYDPRGTLHVSEEHRKEIEGYTY